MSGLPETHCLAMDALRQLGATLKGLEALGKPLGSGKMARQKFEIVESGRPAYWCLTKTVSERVTMGAVLAPTGKVSVLAVGIEQVDHLRCSV